MFYPPAPPIRPQFLMISHKYYSSRPKSTGLGEKGVLHSQQTYCSQGNGRQLLAGNQKKPNYHGNLSGALNFLDYFDVLDFFICKLWHRQLRNKKNSANGACFWFVWVLLALTKRSSPHSPCSSHICFNTSGQAACRAPSLCTMKETSNASVDQGSSCGPFLVMLGTYLKRPVFVSSLSDVICKALSEY